MYSAPQNLFILVIIDLFTRGIIPSTHIVHSMSAVVEYIRKFDRKSPDWPRAAETLIQALDPHVRVLVKTTVWQIEDLDNLHTFFDALRLQVMDKVDRDVHPRPLRSNSLLGGFVLDMCQYFRELEFSGRVEMWRRFAARRQVVFEPSIELKTAKPLFPEVEGAGTAETIHLSTGPATHNALQAIDTAIDAADMHAALDTIHKVFDEDREADPVGALELLFNVFKSNNYIDMALKTAEQGIITARSSHGLETIVRGVLQVCATIQEYPGAAVPKAFGSMTQLTQYLKAVQGDVDATSQFLISLLEISHLRRTGTDIATLATKMSKLLVSYSSICIDESAALQFHQESYKIWTMYGKIPLAACHLAVADVLAGKLDQKAVALRNRTVVLLQEAFQGYTDRSASVLESLQPETTESYQYYKVAKLVLRAIILTRKLEYHSAAKIIEILRAMPTTLISPVQSMVNNAEIELLLAQGKNSEAYHKTMDHYTSTGAPKYLLYAARSLFCFSESSMQVRCAEALEVAEKCMASNSVPILIEASMIKAMAHSQSKSLADVRAGKALCEKMIPVAFATRWPILIADILIVNATCLLQLYYLKDVKLEDVTRAFNVAQKQLNKYSDCHLVAQSRSLHELRHDIAKEGGEDLLAEAYEIKVRPSLVKIASKSIDLKRKSSHNERRPSKRRRSLLLPL